jgi:hypothetical protein
MGARASRVILLLIVRWPALLRRNIVANGAKASALAVYRIRANDE